ncbi:MAG: 4Fe-4S dicluster domain-containing protein [Armatimonadota bacterium]
MLQTTAQTQTALLPAEELHRLVSALAEQYKVFGPVAKGSEVRFSEVCDPQQLKPLYGHTVLSPKKLFHRPVEPLFTAKRAQTFDITPAAEKDRPIAVLGIHPCDLAALLRLDRVFDRGQYKDPVYMSRRRDAFIVAFNCTLPCDKGFCASMGTGPGASEGYDLALTDIEDGYLVEAGSERGWRVLGSLNLETATEQDISVKNYALDRTASQLRKRLDTTDLPQILENEFDHPYWAELKERCLGCANCTMVCPTCFCYDVADQIDLGLTNVKRVRSWDSCLLVQFAQVHGANFRKQREARIKQWIYHKLDYWVAQQGTFGCVGCGRCIRWCPANIDITDVVARMRMEAEA